MRRCTLVSPLPPVASPSSVGLASRLAFGAARLLSVSGRRRRTVVNRRRQAVVLCSPAWIGIGLGLLLNNVLMTPHFPWNSVRLAPTFAMAAGYDIFSPLGGMSQIRLIF